jgi:hypothetical protein
VIEEMRPVPFSLRHVLLLAVAAALPMVSLLFTMYPLDELVLRSVKSLVHL